MKYDAWVAKAARQPIALEFASGHDVVPQNEHFPMSDIHEPSPDSTRAKPVAESCRTLISGSAGDKYDAASDTFKPFTTADEPPQGNDAKCGFACHTIVKTRDYVFTDYGKR
jgi:hypothetical protein